MSMPDNKKIMTDESSTHCGIKIKKAPSYNVLSQEDFQKRAGEIFKILNEVLSRSLGAYGAPTIISNYPYTHSTKDGYTIANNIRFDHISGESVDRVIAGMAMDICARLNYAVGDGTTSAIVATASIYKAMQESKKDFSSIRPRHLLHIFDVIKDKVIEIIERDKTMIEDKDMVEIIKNIVSVSSNNDTEIVDIITNIYEDLRYPAIRSEKSDSAGLTYEIIKGYNIDVRLGDFIYVNTDSKRAEYTNAEVLIYDHQIRRDTYLRILKPLSHILAQLGRHLICIATSYEENALRTIISTDLKEEFEIHKDISLVICSTAYRTKLEQQKLQDLAMLCNTTIITREMDEAMVEEVETTPIYKIINLSKREIEGLRTIAGDEEEEQQVRIIEDKVGNIPTEADNYLLRLGFVDTVSIGEKSSFFKPTHYNEDLYKKALDEASNNIQNVLTQYKMLGTYTVEVQEAKARYTALNMKSAIIYVGGDSDLSRGYRMDAVDDAIRAAESAFEYGYVPGCNLSITAALEEITNDCLVKMGEDASDEDYKLMYDISKILSEGFKTIYRTVLRNKFTHEKDSFLDLIIQKSMLSGKVYDLTTDKENEWIINSAKTDIEILTASVDLLKMLLTGNQVIMTDYLEYQRK